MTKRLLVAAMIGLLSVGTAMNVCAEEPQKEEAPAEQEQKEIVWDETMEALFINDGYAGDIYTVDALGMQILIPEGLEKRQPTDEEKEKDTILVFESKDGKDKVELVLGPIGDCKTLEDVQAFMKEQVPDIDVIPTKINEYATLMYGSEATNSMAVLIGAEDAGFLRVIFSPVNDPQKKELFSFSAASIQMIKD